MIGIPFHSEAGCPSGISAVTASGVSVGSWEVFVGISIGTMVRVNVGTIFGVVCIKLEQAVRKSISKNRLAAMGFFTRPSL